ncbi:MAG TPA: hypothetical protein VGH73_10325 [Thermoanaerobaculia bacterium]|jgi:hypothetical protein
MSRFLARVWPVLPALALFAAPALADVYFVTLTTGAVIETAHQPQQAGWDPNMVLLLTETGNWVGFPKGQIVGIRTEDPTQGFGIRINDKAIALGVSPNDLPDAKGKEDVNQRMYDIANKMLDMAEKRQNYTVQQFVEPSQSQGIPSSFGGLATGGGGAGNNLGGSLGGMMPPPEAGNNTPAPEAGSAPPPNPGSNQ